MFIGSTEAGADISRPRLASITLSLVEDGHGSSRGLSRSHDSIQRYRKILSSGTLGQKERAHWERSWHGPADCAMEIRELDG
jgi:hypothetical protein